MNATIADGCRQGGRTNETHSSGFQHAQQILPQILGQGGVAGALPLIDRALISMAAEAPATAKSLLKATMVACVYRDLVAKAKYSETNALLLARLDEQLLSLSSGHVRLFDGKVEAKEYKPFPNELIRETAQDINRDLNKLYKWVHEQFQQVQALYAAAPDANAQRVRDYLAGVASVVGIAYSRLDQWIFHAGRTDLVKES